MVRFSILTRNREISFERERMRFLASSFARSSALFSICEFECAKTTFVAILLLIWYHISLHNIRGSVKLPFCIYQEGEIPLNLATSHNISFWRLMANPNPLSLTLSFTRTDFYIFIWDAQFQQLDHLTNLIAERCAESVREHWIQLRAQDVSAAQRERETESRESE